MADPLRIWAIRPFVNLPLPKNTTDMSLAVDAMELACVTPKTEQIFIASGDLDFVPLVVRLRERGIKVVCVTERSKMAQDAVPAYDQVIYVGNDQTNQQATTDSKAVTTKAVRATTKKIAIKTLTVKTLAPKPVAAKKAAAPKKPAKSASSVAPEVVTVPRILAAVPNLKSGQWQPLGDVAKLLHDEELLAKSATSTKLFRKFPHHFELTPTGKPNKVRFILP